MCEAKTRDLLLVTAQEHQRKLRGCTQNHSNKSWLLLVSEIELYARVELHYHWKERSTRVWPNSWVSSWTHPNESFEPHTNVSMQKREPRLQETDTTSLQSKFHKTPLSLSLTREFCLSQDAETCTFAHHLKTKRDHLQTVPQRRRKFAAGRGGQAQERRHNDSTRPPEAKATGWNNRYASSA